ncbi:MAG: ABC transporter substrate-binding protein [Gammaproteobacteria bacterium]|nr:ABC transporter substrate-binding protein [Gammaproteobacteria bacterium]MBU0788261.1 ABC transporter substrate-binding protein [Gammaproteobacteria bacterium]MBU0815242.1 ABC transporter substrate-binding protein [Gammaproteobacteria bacterium]MBU1785650.1 ABC transporter substrate-binding protein [Gammaproteobacteria bacterium]
MKLRQLVLAVTVAAAGVSGALVSTAAFAQAKEQFFPVLPYRTGAYAPNGVPWANGYADYLKLINARDKGINGVKITSEECDTGYATDRGVECYERLKSKANGAVFQPLSTGITFALTEKAPNDKNPLLTGGYGRSESSDGMVFKWNFPLMGTYWSGADIIMQHLTKKENGNLKGKKIALVYHDSPYGKEPIPLLQERAKMQGYELMLLPVTHPGVEQKATWLQIRQNRPDYVLLWGWGVMNSAAIKEAVATGYPRNKMYGVWWSAAEPDVKDVGEAAKGYSGLVVTGEGGKVIEDIKKYVHGKNQGTGPIEEVGQTLYNRGMISAALAVEAVRRAQERYGKGKVMNGDQIRWGLENLAVDEKALVKLGLSTVMRPISTSCADHEGSRAARMHTWDGKKWVFSSDWIEADTSIIKPLVKQFADKYAAEKKLTRRTPADCQS